MRELPVAFFDAANGKTVQQTIMRDEWIAIHFTDGTSLLVCATKLRKASVSICERASAEFALRSGACDHDAPGNSGRADT